VLIRLESARDADRIHELQAAAFGQIAEADLAVALRAGGHCIPEMCFVAEIDERVVGHVVCSTGFVGDAPVAGLGPIGVEPDLQHDGIGSALMHAAIGAAEARHEPMIVLLGNPAYYCRFGFTPASDIGIAPPEEAWGPHFQSRALTHHDASLTGTYRYAEPFDQL